MTAPDRTETAPGRAFVESLSEGARQIAAIAANLDGVLTGLDWSGPDADETRDAWRRRSKPRLDLASAHLEALARQIRRGAEDDELGAGLDSQVPAPRSGSPTTTPEASTFVGDGDWLDDRLGMLTASLTSTGDAGVGVTGVRVNGMGVTDTVLDLLTGRRDVPLVTLASEAIGAAAFAAQPLGQVRAAMPVPLEGSQDPRPVLLPPRDLPTLMQGVSDAYAVGAAPGAHGDVRITTITHVDGQVGYVVAIPGTERWETLATGLGREVTGNLQLMAGDSMAAADTVKQAMAAAGIPRRATVMLVGHSQGGMIAANLAADPGFRSEYQLTHLMTYGAPIDHLAIDRSVRVLQIQHRLDVMPRLDLGNWPTGGEPQPTVTLPSAGWSPVTNHSHLAYLESVQLAISERGNDGAALRAWQTEPGLAAFLVGDGDSATAVDVPIGQAPDSRGHAKVNP